MTCSKCGAATSVPFVPTPGRPVFCRDCFQPRADGPGGGPPRGGGGPGGGGRGPPQGGGRGPPRGGFRGRDDFRPPTVGRKRMMSTSRKGHFVADARVVLESGAMPEQERRSFIEMLFTRGARQSTLAAREFLAKKREEDSITRREHDDLVRLVESYSMWR